MLLFNWVFVGVGKLLGVGQNVIYELLRYYEISEHSCSVDMYKLNR